MDGWTITVDIPPPGGTDHPRFGVISKNSRIRGRFWSREAKEWGEFMQWLVKVALVEAGAVAGDADYQVTLEVVKPDNRRLDSHNLCWFIADSLEGVLGADDSRFSFDVPLPVVGDIPLIRLTIVKP
jgi:hypothetical protein